MSLDPDVIRAFSGTTQIGVNLSQRFFGAIKSSVLE